VQDKNRSGVIEGWTWQCTRSHTVELEVAIMALHQASASVEHARMLSTRPRRKRRIEALSYVDTRRPWRLRWTTHSQALLAADWINAQKLAYCSISNVLTDMFLHALSPPQYYYPRRLYRSAWVERLTPSVCLFVVIITQKQMIPKCSNSV